ncbi:Protein kinase-like domain containing protein [Trema orientale]|uniref:Protein kinase-like domain containing protein n=1 Tax=Trema orientale TaxID=63057 RepID=A0A2P5B240_TREOI|nr:Protein kinase-like domain containing protein [Trema orientale]
MGGEPSNQGDVYNYGILMLEMFTGKRTTDEIFKDDFNLHNFVKMALPERLVQIADASLLLRETDETAMTKKHGRNYINSGRIESPNKISADLLKCLVSVLQIGPACSIESPNERMSMGDVVKVIQHIRNAYLGVGMHGRIRKNS